MNRKNQNKKITRHQSIIEEEGCSYELQQKYNHDKIDELHTCMKSYFDFEHTKKINFILPKIQKVQNEIEEYKESLNGLNLKETRNDDRKKLLIRKNKLQDSIKEMAGTLEKVKSKIKSVKLQSQCIKNEIETKNLIFERMEKLDNSRVTLDKIISGKHKSKKQSMGIREEARKRSILLIQDRTKMQSTDLIFEPCQEWSVEKKWKKIQNLLHLISIEQPTYRLQGMLSGDLNIPVGKKVFKDFSVDNYFNQVMKIPSVKKQLKDIMNFLQIYD